MRLSTQALLAVTVAIGGYAACPTKGAICGAGFPHCCTTEGMTCVKDGYWSRCHHRCEDGGDWCPPDKKKCYEDINGTRECYACLLDGFDCNKDGECCSGKCSDGGRGNVC